MAEDMRETIANAAKTLLFDKKVRKLTVKDIVEECHITRQTFYYHFEDIPDLMAWSLRRNFDRVIAQCQAQKNGEEALRYHCGGVRFLLRDWKEQDTAELDAIAHRLYQGMIREENPL